MTSSVGFSLSAFDFCGGKKFKRRQVEACPTKTLSMRLFILW
jgi:hypothetical protein